LRQVGGFLRVLRFPPPIKLKYCWKGYQTTRPADNSDRDKSARKRGVVGPYVKTTRTVWKDYSDHQWLLLSYLFFLIKLTEIIKIQSFVKSIGKCKKKSLYNQPKPYFFQKIIVKSFLDRFLQILHQNIWNCLYFDWLFTHYGVMSDFYCT
jgi:hypothetical protein